MKKFYLNSICNASVVRNTFFLHIILYFFHPCLKFKKIKNSKGTKWIDTLNGVVPPEKRLKVYFNIMRWEGQVSRDQREGAKEVDDRKKNEIVEK